MAETLEQLATRILKAVPKQKHDEFLDWAISGQPIRTEAEKQDIITTIKQEVKEMEQLQFTVDRPSPNTQELCNQRLLERDLLHGSSFVVKVKGRYYGGGDRQHNSISISHNLKKLLELLKYGNWTYCGKAYDSDMYFSRQRITPPILRGLIQYTKLEFLETETS